MSKENEPIQTKSHAPLSGVSNSRFEIHCYCKDTYEKLYGFPENSYFFDDEDEAIECLSALIKNKQSGIYKAELVQNDFC